MKKLIILFTVFLFSCGEECKTHKDVEKVRIGMPLDSVIQILGNPSSVTFDSEEGNGYFFQYNVSVLVSWTLYVTTKSDTVISYTTH